VLQLWWAPPGADVRLPVLSRLRTEERPLYLPAGLPLLRQTLHALQTPCEAQVFARFAERTFAAFHRDWRPTSPMEQRIIMGHLLRTRDLPELSPIQAKPGMVKAALRVIAELKQAGIAPSEWPGALSHGKGPALARLADAYQEHLESRRLADQEDVLRMAAAALQQHGPERKPSLVLIEGFAALNALERGAIQALSQHVPVVMIVTYDPARPALFAPTLASLSEWWQGAIPIHEPAARPEALAALQDRLFGSGGAPAPASRTAVTFTEAPDPAREVAEAARTIKQLLLAGQCRPDEIAIVSNQPDRDRELVRRVAAQYGIPVALPPEPLITAPVVQALLALVRGEPGAAKSPYLPAEASVAPAAAATQVAPVAEHCAALARTLPGLEVERRILDLMHQGGLTAGAAALGARELVACRAFLRTLVRLEQIHRQAELPADVSREEFAALLAEELAEATYHTHVRHPGPAVRFLVPAQTEGLAIAVIFMVGLSEGEFPTARGDDWVLPDRRRRTIVAPGRLVTREHHRQVERLQFLRVVRAATGRLFLSRSTAGAGGEALFASSFWEEAMACLGAIAPDRKLPGSEVAPARFDRVSSRGELLSHLVAVLRHGTDDPQEAALAAELLEHGVPGLAPDARAALDHRITVDDARRSPAYTPWDGRLTDPDVVARLAEMLAGDRRFSASELETYAACPFRYLGERVLAVREADAEEPDLDAREVGTALHRILAAFYRTPGLDLLAPEAEQRLALLVRQETGALVGRLGPALQEAWRRQLQRQAMAWLESERAVHRQAQAAAPPAEHLTPAYLEWSFGQKVRPGCDPASTTEPLVLAAGDQTYRVAGVVDRIDLDQEGGYSLYDYKSGKSPGGSEITGSKTRLQIPLYLLAARRLGLKGALRPIGGAYYGLKDRKRTGGIWRKSKKAVHGVSYYRSLLEDAEFDQTLVTLEEHITGLIGNLTGGDMTVNPRVQCPAYCPMRPVCRFDEARLEAKAGRAGKESAGA
jgi:ATP-dependent helicase/nuclease subunit B